MNVQYVFRSLMIIGILACIILPFTFSDDTQSKITSSTLTPFTAKAAKFTIGLPTGWDISETNTNGVWYECKAAGIDGAKIFISQSFVDDLKAGISGTLTQTSPLADQHKIDVMGLEKRLKDYEESDTVKSTLGEAEAYITKYKYKSASGFIRRPMCGVLVTTYNGTVPITMKMACPARDFDSMQILFQRCLDTFTPSSGVETEQ